MADRVPATITLGGVLSGAQFASLLTALGDEGLVTCEEDIAAIQSEIAAGNSLQFDEAEVAWGYFAALETYCTDNALPFVRWCGGYGGGWDPQRIVFTGAGDPRAFLATEDDRVVLTQDDVLALGSIDAITAHFAVAAFEVPPLAILDEEQAHG